MKHKLFSHILYPNSYSNGQGVGFFRLISFFRKQPPFKDGKLP